MRSIVLVYLIAMFSLAAHSQSIRKSGSRYLGVQISYLEHGTDLGVYYEQYLNKGFSYQIKGVFEKSVVELTTYDTYRVELGANKSFSSGLHELYFNSGLFTYLGTQLTTNEYYPQRNNFVYGFLVTPNAEYFITNNLSVSLGVSAFLDFRNEFRDKHFSLNLSIRYLI